MSKSERRVMKLGGLERRPITFLLLLPSAAWGERRSVDHISLSTTCSHIYSD